MTTANVSFLSLFPSLPYHTFVSPVSQIERLREEGQQKIQEEQEVLRQQLLRQGGE